MTGVYFIRSTCTIAWWRVCTRTTHIALHQATEPARAYIPKRYIIFFRFAKSTLGGGGWHTHEQTRSPTVRLQKNEYKPTIQENEFLLTYILSIYFHVVDQKSHYTHRFWQIYCIYLVIKLIGLSLFRSLRFKDTMLFLVVSIYHHLKKSINKHSKGYFRQMVSKDYKPICTSKEGLIVKMTNRTSFYRYQVVVCYTYPSFLLPRYQALCCGRWGDPKPWLFYRELGESLADRRDSDNRKGNATNMILTTERGYVLRKAIWRQLWQSIVCNLFRLSL